MKWTKEPPAVPGWYLCSIGGQSPIFVEVGVQNSGLLVQLFGDVQSPLDPQPDELWLGPLPEPEDAEPTG